MIAALLAVVSLAACGSESPVDVGAGAGAGAGEGGWQASGASPATEAAGGCATTTSIIDDARGVVRSSPLAATIDVNVPNALADLDLARAGVVGEGRIRSVRQAPEVVVAGADGLPDAPGGPLAWAGVEIDVATDTGPVSVALPLVLGGRSVVGQTPLRTEALEALVGACAVVAHGTGDGVAPLGSGVPRVLALAPDRSSPPVPLDPVLDRALSGFATPAALVEAIDASR